MYLEIYIDVIFIINFIMDIILLHTVKKILKCTSSFWRILCGAGIGAIGACIVSLIPSLNALIQFLLSYIVICTAMVYIAYNQKSWKARIKTVILLYITTFFLGGVINSIYYYTNIGYYFKELIQGRLFSNRNSAFFALAILIMFVTIPIFIKSISNLHGGSLELYPVELLYKDKSVRVVGLLDTGNSLYDPIYGKPVIIAECSALESLFSTHQANILNTLLDTVEGTDLPDKKMSPLDTDHLYDEGEEQLNIMMIPYHSIGKNGMLPAILMSRIIIWDGEEQICNEKVLTAVSRNRISKEREYQLILHRDIM